MQKYFLYIDADMVLAVKFNPIEGTLTIGGNVKFERQMEMILAEYFECELGNCSRIMTQANKARYVCEIEREKFHEGLTRLEEHGFTLTQTDNLERIMR